MVQEHWSDKHDKIIGIFGDANLLSTRTWRGEETASSRRAWFCCWLLSLLLHTLLFFLLNSQVFLYPLVSADSPHEILWFYPTTLPTAERASVAATIADVAKPPPSEVKRVELPKDESTSAVDESTLRVVPGFLSAGTTNPASPTRPLVVEGSQVKPTMAKPAPVVSKHLQPSSDSTQIAMASKKISKVAQQVDNSAVKRPVPPEVLLDQTKSTKEAVVPPTDRPVVEAEVVAKKKDGTLGRQGPGLALQARFSSEHKNKLERVLQPEHQRQETAGSEERTAEEMSERERLGQERHRMEVEKQARHTQEAEQERRFKAAAEEAQRVKLATEQARRVKEAAEHETRLKVAAEEAQRAKLAVEQARRVKEAAEQEKRLKAAAEEAQRVKLAAEQTRRVKAAAERSRAAADSATEQRVAVRINKQELSKRDATPSGRPRSNSGQVLTAESSALPLPKTPERQASAKKPSVSSEAKGIFVAPLRGDLKIELVGSEEQLASTWVTVTYRELSMAQRSKPPSRSASLRHISVSPKVARTSKNGLQAVVENVGAGIYYVRLQSGSQQGIETSIVVTTYEGSSRGRVQKLSGRRILPNEVFVKILMPEGVLWSDDAAFTGSLEDSDSTTKFNAATGLVWKEYR